MSDIEKLIGTAAQFIGITEQPPNSNNVIFNTHYYGREVSGSAYPWCAAFVWDIFRLAGLSELYLGGGKTAGCADILNYAKSAGAFIASDFRRGDIVLYRFDRTAAAANHTGIITHFSGGRLRAIEGNTSAGDDSNGGAVMERERTLENVAGAYRPCYKGEETLTYEQFEEYMKRYLSIESTGDVCSDWAKKAADTLRECGIAVGSEDDFGWQKPATKETVAQMLYNYMQKTKGE